MEAFAREISECGDADSGDFSGTACSTAALEDSEDLDSFFIRGQKLLTSLQEAGEAVSETLFNALVLNGLPMRYESFCYTGKLQPGNELHRVEKKAAELS